jgi:serine/threonine protein kinase
MMQVDVLSRVYHKHLVALVGYCQEHDKRIVIYEYMPKGSLRDLLYGTYQTPCRNSKYLFNLKSLVHWYFVDGDLQFLQFRSYISLVLMIDFENDDVQQKKTN